MPAPQVALVRMLSSRYVNARSICLRPLLPALLWLAGGVLLIGQVQASDQNTERGLATETAPSQAPDPPQDRPRIGLVLSGGGARGIAHIGVLEVLEELRVPVDLVVGTSMGALVGGFYATGMTALELVELVEGIRWNDVFSDRTARENRSFRRKRDDELGLPGPKIGFNREGPILADGMLAGQNAELFLQAIAIRRSGNNDFDDLPVPFRAVASDLASGEATVIKGGNLARAMRASMSLPGVFSPVEYNGQLLVDGGITRNLPVDVALALGADIIIAVDVAAPLRDKAEIFDLTNISEQMSRLLVYGNTQEQIKLLREQDILIQPALGDEYSSTGFAESPGSIPLGREAASEQSERLAQLSLSYEDYAAYQSAKAGRVQSKVSDPIAFVELHNETDYDDAVILHKLPVKLGNPIDLDELGEAIGYIHSSGYFKQVRYDLITRDGETGLRVDALPDIRTPNLIEYGASLYGNGSENRFALRVGYLRTNVDSLGTEWRVVGESGENTSLTTELYKPLDTQQRYFALPRAYGFRRSIDVYDDGTQLGRLRDARTGASLALGHEFSSILAMQAGYEYYHGRLSVGSGVDFMDGYRFTGSELFFNVRRDTLDDRYLPARGSALELHWRGARASLGSDDGFDQIELDYLNSRSRGRNVITTSVRIAATPGSDAPVHAQYLAGGFNNLSGLRRNELSGQHLAIIGVDLRRRMFESSLLPGFLGLSLEYGNVWQSRSDISFDDGISSAALYFGYRSPIGPFVFGYAQASTGRGQFFIDLGRRY